MFFFFQAEDGIRDVAVTGVQTCALPISRHVAQGRAHRGPGVRQRRVRVGGFDGPGRGDDRSEERRVGKSVDLGGRRIIKKKKKWIKIMRLSVRERCERWADAVTEGGEDG